MTRFATFKTRKGEVRRRSVCWDCRGKYAKENFERLQVYRREYHAKNKTLKQERDAERRAEMRELVDQQKDQPCIDCGKKWPPVAMDFDHVRGDKIMDVARMVGSAYRWELIAAEIAKCEVVCACCHRLRTAARKQNAASHSQHR